MISLHDVLAFVTSFVEVYVSHNYDTGHNIVQWTFDGQNMIGLGLVLMFFSVMVEQSFKDIMNSLQESGFHRIPCLVIASLSAIGKAIIIAIVLRNYFGGYGTIESLSTTPAAMACAVAAYDAYRISVDSIEATIQPARKTK